MFSLSKKRIAIMIGLVVAVVAGLSIYYLLKSNVSVSAPIEDEVPLVRVMTIAPNPGGQEYVYAGEVRGRHESQMAFLVGGRIVNRRVDAGSRVRVGQVLMQIDPQDVQQTANSQSAQVAAAKSQLQLAEQNLKRYRQLFEEEVISKAQLERYQSAFEVAQASYQQAQAIYSQSMNQLAYTELRADRPGVVAAINGETGQVVGPGQPVVTLVQDGEREVEISVPEQRIGGFSHSPSIGVSFWAFPKVVVEGRVREIAPVADPVSRTYKVRVSLPKAPPEIELGMTASVTVAPSTDRPPASCLLPLSAMYQTKETTNVWVVENGVAHLRAVKTGLFTGDQVEIADGLNPGAIVVTAGVHKLREGQRVKTTTGEER